MLRHVYILTLVLKIMKKTVGNLKFLTTQEYENIKIFP